MNLKTLQLEGLRRLPSGVLRAPAWLRERMRRVRALPPPTLEEVTAQWAASARQIERDELNERIARGEVIR